MMIYYCTCKAAKEYSTDDDVVYNIVTRNLFIPYTEYHQTTQQTQETVPLRNTAQL